MPCSSAGNPCDHRLCSGLHMPEQVPASSEQLDGCNQVLGRCWEKVDLTMSYCLHCPFLDLLFNISEVHSSGYSGGPAIKKTTKQKQKPKPRMPSPETRLPPPMTASVTLTHTGGSHPLFMPSSLELPMSRIYLDAMCAAGHCPLHPSRATDTVAINS